MLQVSRGQFGIVIQRSRRKALLGSETTKFTVALEAGSFSDRHVAVTHGGQGWSLHRIDRYGVTKRNEQYQGFKRLEAANPQSQRETAAKWLTDISCIFVPAQNCTAETLNRAYIAAAGKLHPDKGGSHDDFVRLQETMRILRSAA